MLILLRSIIAMTAPRRGNRDNVDAWDQHWHIVHWVGGSGGQQWQRHCNGG